MHISDVQPANKKILTKCTKMTTEEENCNARGGSINLSNGFGDRSNDKSSTVRSSPIKEEDAKNVYGQGGRLKFFKGNNCQINIKREKKNEKLTPQESSTR